MPNLQSVTSITVTPAYGRDYRSAEAARRDWNAGKDFTVQAIHPPQRTGMYINKRDLMHYSPQAEVRIRFDKKQQVTTLQPPHE